MDHQNKYDPNQRDRSEVQHFDWEFNNQQFFKKEDYYSELPPNKCLAINPLPQNLSTHTLETTLENISIATQVSIPNQIKICNSNNTSTALIIYPSIEASTKVLYHLQGNIDIHGTDYKIDFHVPQTRFKGIIDRGQVLVQDWACDKCNYNNFARRIKCNKCENIRNPNCKIIYNSAAIVKTKWKQQVIPASASTSIMVRGAVICRMHEKDILQIFNRVSPVKDVRMVRNRQTGYNKDFAFIEFFTIEAAEKVINKASNSDFRIGGEVVSINFSKTKRQDKKDNQPVDFNPYELWPAQMLRNDIKQQIVFPLKQAKIRKFTQKDKRKRIQSDMKRWQREQYLKNSDQVWYVCVLCKRKFQDQKGLKDHQTYSKLHRQSMIKFNLC